MRFTAGLQKEKYFLLENESFTMFNLTNLISFDSSKTQ